MKARFINYFIIVSAVLWNTTLSAELSWKAKEYPATAAHAPTPLPDRVVLTWDGNPATSQAVTWRTDVTVMEGKAQLAVANANGRALQPDTFIATTTHFESDINAAHYHSVTFKGLQPETLYAYRVGDGVNWTEYYHFKTASSEAKPFSFIYFGDAQNDIRTHWSRVFREAFRDAPRAAFTLHAGDLIDEDAWDAEWGQWHQGPDWVNGTIPVVATPGNHEYFQTFDRTQKSRVRKQVSTHWRPQFAFPIQDVPDASLQETVYYLDYQGVRFISLDSNTAQAAQVPWLREVLENNPHPWTIVTFHHPVFSPASDRDNTELRELWKPLFDEFQVDLVLSGHDHIYARTGEVDQAKVFNVPSGYQQAYDPNIGTVYVVSVSGPKLYKVTKGKYAKRFAENTQLYQIINIEGNQLRFRAFTATGNLYDEFLLQKQPEQPNLLIEAFLQQ